MFDIKKAAELLGITPLEVFLYMMELESLGLISMRPVGEEFVAIKVHPLEILRKPGGNIGNVVRSYQLQTG